MLTFHAEKADLKKCICLITRLLGEEERGARLRLGGSLGKKKKMFAGCRNSPPSQGAFDQEKWASRLVPTSGLSRCGSVVAVGAGFCGSL